MDSIARALALLERELHLELPRALFAPGGHGAHAPLDPGDLLDPGSGALGAGRILPDALPFAVAPGGERLALRFDARGRPLEIVAVGGGGAWHPTGEVPGFPSDAARARAACEAALASGLRAAAAARGAGALADAVGVAADSMSDWLVDARLVPPVHRAALARLVGEEEAALFAQDWAAAADAARDAARLRPELAWPGVVLGWEAEARGDALAATRAYASAIRALGTTLDLAARWVRAGELADRVLAAAWERSRAPGDAPDPAVRAVLVGPAAVRARWIEESDRALAAGHPAEAYRDALRAGWDRWTPADMDDVLGRLADAADRWGSAALAALARLHLRSWVAVG